MALVINVFCHTKAGGKVICAQTCVYINAHMSFDRKKGDSETQGRINEFGTVFQKDLNFSLSNPADVLCDCSEPTQLAVCPLFQVGDNRIASTPIFCTPDWVLL